MASARSSGAGAGAEREAKAVSLGPFRGLGDPGRPSGHQMGQYDC